LTSPISPTAISVLRVGTRGSALALKQTDIAIDALRAATASVTEFEIVPIKTTGDAVPDKPFEAIGPKGVFAHELQRALMDGRIDVAVHSLKDLPSVEPEGLVLAAVLEREDARDVLVSRDGALLTELPDGAVVGTSSARRRALVARECPALRSAPLRGNVDTRIDKVMRGEVDAAVLAGAGLIRLEREDAITEWLDPLRFIPPPGQGAIVVDALAVRFDDDLQWLRGAEHARSRACVDAERTFMRRVEGGCEVPLGAWARDEEGAIVCDAFVASEDASEFVRDRCSGSVPESVGGELARRILERGGAHLTQRR
jgi:hydroxymethylbilane synthase